MPSHVPMDFQDAYRQYVRDMQRSYDEERGFTPIDRLLFNQPVAMLVRNLVAPKVDLGTEDKHALISYHYALHDVTLTD